MADPYTPTWQQVKDMTAELEDLRGENKHLAAQLQKLQSEYGRIHAGLTSEVSRLNTEAKEWRDRFHRLEYQNKLAALSSVERARMMYGNWDQP